MTDFKFQITDRDENIIWAGSGRKEANSAFKEAVKELPRNFIRMKEFKRGEYITVKGTCT